MYGHTRAGNISKATGNECLPIGSDINYTIIETGSPIQISGNNADIDALLLQLIMVNIMQVSQ